MQNTVSQKGDISSGKLGMGAIYEQTFPHVARAVQIW